MKYKMDLLKWRSQFWAHVGESPRICSPDGKAFVEDPVKVLAERYNWVCGVAR